MPARRLPPQPNLNDPPILEHSRLNVGLLGFCQKQLGYFRPRLSFREDGCVAMSRRWNEPGGRGGLWNAHYGRDKRVRGHQTSVTACTECRLKCVRGRAAAPTAAVRAVTSADASTSTGPAPEVR